MEGWLVGYLLDPVLLWELRCALLHESDELEHHANGRVEEVEGCLNLESQAEGVEVSRHRESNRHVGGSHLFLHTRKRYMSDDL